MYITYISPHNNMKQIILISFSLLPKEQLNIHLLTNNILNNSSIRGYVLFNICVQLLHLPEKIFNFQLAPWNKTRRKEGETGDSRLAKLFHYRDGWKNSETVLLGIFFFITTSVQISQNRYFLFYVRTNSKRPRP